MSPSLPNYSGFPAALSRSAGPMNGGTPMPRVMPGGMQAPPALGRRGTVPQMPIRATPMPGGGMQPPQGSLPPQTAFSGGGGFGGGRTAFGGDGGGFNEGGDAGGDRSGKFRFRPQVGAGFNNGSNDDRNGSTTQGYTTDGLAGKGQGGGGRFGG
jgi:hypothetical protein